MEFVDTAAVAIEVLRKAGIRAELEPPSDDTAEPPLVVVQDAGPVSIRNSKDGLGTNTVISLSTVARSRAAASATADRATMALVKNVGQYDSGRLVYGRAVNLPRPVGQNVLPVDNAYQRHSMVKIIVRNITS